MNSLQLADVVQYVETNIGGFHATRLQNLSKLKLPVILARKNPYLFKVQKCRSRA
jgi:hypothetical protein